MHTISGDELDQNGRYKDIFIHGSCIYISGCSGKDGKTWILDQNTFKLVTVLEKHTGEVNVACLVGPLIWTVSWDFKIFAWNPKDHSFKFCIPTHHTDAIVSILPIENEKGLIVWTGSSDRTINIMFVPKNYYPS